MQTLKDRDSVPERTDKCKLTSKRLRFISFGIFVNQLSNQETMKDTLLERGFKTETLSQQDVLNGETLHFISKKGSVVIHVATFTPRSEFFLIQKMKEAPLGLRLPDFRYGRFLGAFDGFRLKYSMLNGIKMLFPEDPAYFLFQIKYSRFEECHHELAALWEKSYPKNIDMAKKMTETVYVMRNLTKKALLPIWLDGGSLIGWARHCGEVPHERDADCFLCTNEPKWL